jgi:hypothetical protein
MESRPQAYGLVFAAAICGEGGESMIRNSCGIFDNSNFAAYWGDQTFGVETR